MIVGRVLEEDELQVSVHDGAVGVAALVLLVAPP